MPIKVDKNLCIGCGACEAICPEVFKLKEDGKADAISQDTKGCAKSAEEGCPVQAIKVS